MKAITLWQPWASLIACGAKRFETRSWSTNYRGPIAIHAAAKPAHKTFSEIIDYDTSKAMFEYLIPLGIYFPADLPHGCIIATAKLTACYKVISTCTAKSHPDEKIVIIEGARSHEILISKNEYDFGDWTPGRYVFKMSDIMKLDKPIPAKGKQGLWEWEVS